MRSIKRRIIIILFYLFRIFPISSKKIVVSSFVGRGYGNEGKAIIDELLKNRNDLDVVWLCKNLNENLPNGVRGVKYRSMRAIYEQVTAKIWIDNCRKVGYVRKRKGQYYIQTWHSSVCIKYVEKDAEDTLSKDYVYSAKNDSKMADLFVSGCKWRTRNYKEAFWYDGEIMQGDLYDIMAKEENASDIEKHVKEVLGIDPDSNILTYAPTFRNDSNMDCYDIDYERLLYTLKKKYSGKWCIVVRLHPNIMELNTKIKYTNNVINGSLYAQIEDLICASKILISDYSGVIFTGLKRKKVVFLYASDYEDYIAKERRLYFDFETMPSPILKSNDELIECIESFDYSKYEEKRDKFNDEIGYYKTNAAEVVVDRIIEVIGNK